jgi:hypothetical protein
LIVYLLETGLVLLVAPWSTFWERNLWVEALPWFGGVVQLAAMRGAVSGVGAVNLGAGVWELLAWVREGVGRLQSGETPAVSEDTGSCVQDR